MGIQTALDAVQNADRVVDALRLADDLAFEAASTGGARTIRILGGAIGAGDGDQLTTIAAIHALARVFDLSIGVVEATGRQRHVLAVARDAARAVVHHHLGLFRPRHRSQDVSGRRLRGRRPPHR